MARTAALLLAMSVFGCASGSRATFRATDPTFRHQPGPAPRAYLEADIDEIPRVPMRSVGIIEVVARTSAVARAVDAAVEKGQQLGCWILVEHSAFDNVQSRGALSFGGRIYLTHGPAPHIGGAPKSRVTLELDCVVKGSGLRAFRATS